MTLNKNILKATLSLAVMCIAFSVAGAQDTTRSTFGKVVVTDNTNTGTLETGMSFTNVAADTPVFVDLPDQYIRPRSSFFIVPITTGDITGKNIISFDFEVQFDPTLMSPVMDAPTSNEGTLSKNFMITVNPYLPGRLLVSGYGPYPMTGEGTLLNLNFHLVGQDGCNTPLTWQRFMYNEGIPSSITTDGRIMARKR